MPIPDLLEPSNYEFYRQLPMPPGGWPRRDTPEALLKAANDAHDNVKQLIRENDRLRKALIQFHERQDRWVRILVAGLGTLATGIISIFAWVIPYAIRGMAK